MQTPKDKFTLLIKKIVWEEMSEDEQTQFEFDGAERIDRLLNNASESNDEHNNAKSIFIGISPEGIDGIKVITEFGGLLVACISLYFEIRSYKSPRINKKMEKVEAQRKLLAYMKEQQLPAEMIEKINKQYAASLVETLDELS